MVPEHEQCVCPVPQPPMTELRVSWCPVHGPAMRKPTLRVVKDDEQKGDSRK
jgi:hypothetical protein